MHFVIRADANRHIGTGHIMRTLAFAEHCRQRSIDVSLLYSECPESLLERWSDLGTHIQPIKAFPGMLADAQELKQFAEGIRSDCVIIDGHHFGDRYQRELSKRPFKLVAFDDYGQCQKNYADIILNQNASASEDLYLNIQDSTTLLLGPKFAILRSEFRTHERNVRSSLKAPENLFITTGGADPHDASLSILKSILDCQSIPSLNIKLIAGTLNPNFEELQTIATKSKNHRIEIIKHIDHIVSTMDWADLAITGGGTTLQELLYLGVPSVVLSLVPNQFCNANIYSKKYRTCEFLGDITAFDRKQFSSFFETWIHKHSRLKNLSKNAFETVDGKGVERLLASIRKKCKET